MSLMANFLQVFLDILIIFGAVSAYKVRWLDTVIQWSWRNFNLPKFSTPSRFYGFFGYVIYKWLLWRVVKATNWTMWVRCQPHVVLLCGQNDKATHLPSATATSFSLRGSEVWKLQPTLWICAVLCGDRIWRYNKKYTFAWHSYSFHKPMKVRYVSPNPLQSTQNSSTSHALGQGGFSSMPLASSPADTSVSCL